ncbi:MAG TPA: hypothetical protein VFF30_14695 [Nitrososphaerales archaeon]|nr:hypothetical protein [Nitrososphaerales archaeon]
MNAGTSFASGLRNIAQTGLASITTFFRWSVANATNAANFAILYLWET